MYRTLRVSQIWVVTSLAVNDDAAFESNRKGKEAGKRRVTRCDETEIYRPLVSSLKLRISLTQEISLQRTPFYTMLRPAVLLWPLLLLINVVLADVQIVSPSKGATFTPSNDNVTIDVKWKESGSAPYLKNMKYYVITLEGGPNLHIDQIATLANVTNSDVSKDGDNYSVTVGIDATTIGSGQYYIQVFAAITSDASQYSIHYTPRFNLKNMEGSKKETYSDSTQPSAALVYSMTLGYVQQTGVNRTAPMQMQPSTKVTATTWTMQFPTSAVTYYSTFKKSPECHTTVTPGWSYTLNSGWNHATAQPQPSQNGGWYNPKKRQSLSTRKLNLSAFLTQSTQSA